MIKTEIVDIPMRGGYSKYLKEIQELPEGKALKISGLTSKEANALRMSCFRKGRIRSQIVKENGTVTLYLYKRQGGTP